MPERPVAAMPAMSAASAAPPVPDAAASSHMPTEPEQESASVTESIDAPASVAPVATAVQPPDEEADASQDYDSFAPEPPFRPRRNPARLWLIGGILFLIAISAAGAALYRFGVPGWAVNLGLASNMEEPDLLFYLAKPAERRKLPTGEEYFAFSARIVNSGETMQAVPPVLVELRDKQNRLVFSWTTKADKAQLKPGEETAISESRLDIPKNAENLSLAFVDKGR